MDIALPEAFTKVLDQGLELIYGLETYVAPTVVLGTTDLTLSLCCRHMKTFSCRRYYMQFSSHHVSLAYLYEQSRPSSVPGCKPFRNRLVSMSRH
jgi:hypothetical protein